MHKAAFDARPAPHFRHRGSDIAQLEVMPSPARTGNTGLSLGQRMFLKAFRRVRTGINPEVEVGRFLTEVARFPNAVPLAGTVDYLAADGTAATVAVLQGYVENQGDGWSYTVDYLERFLEERRSAKDPAANDARSLSGTGAYAGPTDGELHRALATPSDDPAFSPEPVDSRDLRCGEAGPDEAHTTFRSSSSATASCRMRYAPTSTSCSLRDTLQTIEGMPVAEVDGLKTVITAIISWNRYSCAAMIRDHRFRGETARPFSERRAK